VKAAVAEGRLRRTERQLEQVLLQALAAQEVRALAHAEQLTAAGWADLFGEDTWAGVIDHDVAPGVARVLRNVASVILNDVLSLWPDDAPPIPEPDVGAAVGTFTQRARELGPIIASRLQQEVDTFRNPSHRQLRQALRESFGYGETRARMIARTETAQAVNSATDEAMRPAHAAGIVQQREWLATSDARVRPSHAEADGQRRSMDAAFQVGGADLQYPGDPAGPASEVVNCRCCVLYLTE
jgi:hypothetical protein